MPLREDYGGRAREIEIKIKNKLKDCGYSCEKNPDKYDIDIITRDGKNQFYVEVEESYPNFWPSNKTKPTVPSGLITMPIRKIKFFIADGERMSTFLQANSTVSTINEFCNIYRDACDKKTFEPKKDSARIWIKTSYEAISFCIADQIDITLALNRKLPDQDAVDQRIKEISDHNTWQFVDNIWYNPLVRGSSGEIRGDPVLLILGTVNADNQRLIWDSMSNLCSGINEVLKRFKRSVE